MADDKITKVRLHPELYKLRAMKILDMTLTGHSMEAVAKHFNIHPDTVRRSLVYARREGLTLKYEEQILQDLVPEAMRVYRDKLSEGDAYVAKDVLDKVQKLGERFAAKEDKAEEMTLQAWRDARKLEAKGAKQDAGAGSEGTVKQLNPTTSEEFASSGDLYQLGDEGVAEEGAEGD